MRRGGTPRGGGTARPTPPPLPSQVLNAIGSGDLAAYKEFCHPSVSCFEPEAKGHLVEGTQPTLRSLPSSFHAVAAG
jgi:hypothetical protein